MSSLLFCSRKLENCLLTGLFIALFECPKRDEKAFPVAGLSLGAIQVVKLPSLAHIVYIEFTELSLAVVSVSFLPQVIG